jgi:rhodanese-related sulfurtransferase
MVKNSTLMIINVLSPDAYADCHITGSINVPFDKLADFAKNIDKNQPIVVYCSSYICSASRKAWELLKSLGFKNIWAYEGGMAEWFGLGFASQGACQADYVTQKHKAPIQTGRIQVITAKELHTKMQQAGLL